MKQITKSYLEYLGITEVTTDGKVFTKRGMITPGTNGNGYQLMKFRGCKEGKKPHNIYIHQIVYAWFNNEVPYGKTLHHKDLDRSNNSLDNLVAMSPEEHRELHNLLRNCKTEEKCRLDIPREHYVKKIAEYEANGAYSNAAQYRRRLKYYDNHIAEANQKIKDAKDLELLKYLKDEYRKSGDKARWHMFNSIIKEWKTYSSKIKEQIMQSALGKIGTFGGNN